MSEKAFLVDTTKCLGCRACQVACKQWNSNPAEETDFFSGIEYTNPRELSAITWNHVRFYELDRSDELRPVWSIMHAKCNHCRDANCMKACPEKAIFKDKGWTVIDQDKCIGCGACVSACVYRVPHIAKKSYPGYERIKKDKSYKCHGCTKNFRDVPACVYACPDGALTVDYRIRILVEAKKRLKKYKEIFPNASIYGLEQYSGLNVITILKDDPEKFGLVKKPEMLKVSGVEHINDLYQIFSVFSLGFPYLKRKAYRVARSIITGTGKLS